MNASNTNNFCNVNTSGEANNNNAYNSNGFAPGFKNDMEKELNNKVNRRCNCDDANTSKVVEAAQEQLAAIRILRDRGMVEQLPAKMQQAIEAREKNPEASLTELAALMDPPITKPAMNNRLKKMVKCAKEAVQ